MKLALFFSALLSAQVLAAPEPDYAVVKDGEYTYTGIDKGLLAARGLEERCNCFPECRRPGSNCAPGKCECSGNYGCWACGGGRMQCQPGPGSGVCWTK
ncbi:uncharacterized protein B0J16DRAFT_416678 [Fusarium flagelliforme]|uniref:Uncharacterized protein n=1 Tax=Fusarium flagelliforme TaxID=2675880 RepID=A0A395MTS5_9HYPO|nr:uncharacterized protein B0J16DRAFT_416678 [Fusarium flagelliforme]KAH7183645.1 hypothetical protein B0J16DRAFT_416678 [Fusarium flagelliforme]RFN51351.1 hypothetical protein FIE12Z_4405 [Fusarium flagelliforme]